MVGHSTVGSKTAQKSTKRTRPEYGVLAVMMLTWAGAAWFFWRLVTNRAIKKAQAQASPRGAAGRWVWVRISSRLLYSVALYGAVHYFIYWYFWS